MKTWQQQSAWRKRNGENSKAKKSVNENGNGNESVMK
jgi:hypothetical protein